MQTPRIVPEQDWLAARKSLLEKEKAFTAARDALAAERRQLPMVRVSKDYAFDAPSGRVTLAALFAGKSQLVVYHFMFGPDWKQGCKSCSFWADGFSRAEPHLAARDVALAAVSRAPLDRLEAFKARMGWTFPWVSSLQSDFNFDYQVSFPPEELQAGAVLYNYERRKFPGAEAPGLSVFVKDAEGTVYHSYSAYARGLDALNPAYQILDLVPKGRDEGGLAWPMQWLRLHDEY